MPGFDIDNVLKQYQTLLATPVQWKIAGGGGGGQQKQSSESSSAGGGGGITNKETMRQLWAKVIRATEQHAPNIEPTHEVMMMAQQRPNNYNTTYVGAAGGRCTMCTTSAWIVVESAFF